MSVLRINLKYDKITEKMDEFIKGDSEGNAYTEVRIGGFLPKRLSQIREADIVLEPIKYDSSKEFISLSELKKKGIFRIDAVEKYYFTKPTVGHTQVDRFSFSDDEIVYVKCQSSSDRTGFYKEFWGGDLIAEKNYGDCSCFFKMSELVVYYGWDL